MSCHPDASKDRDRLPASHLAGKSLSLLQFGMDKSHGFRMKPQ